MLPGSHLFYKMNQQRVKQLPQYIKILYLDWLSYLAEIWSSKRYIFTIYAQVQTFVYSAFSEWSAVAAFPQI